ncbi:MAG TPA: class I SAM-dependent methyltransferase [Chloroflexota bacterium]|nr:class I SAM-dependent methyltransferase [Chloroflexota bacterium]
MSGIARYDAIADWYDRFVGETGGARFERIEWPCLRGILGDVRGRPVLDLACGQGFLSRLLARAGARVTAIDLSTALLALARKREAAEPLGIDYHHDDATDLGTLADGSFDWVICRYALMDISDLGAVYRAVARVLRPRGRFVAVVTHPCFYAPHAGAVRDAAGEFLHWRSDRYFDEGAWQSDNPDGVRGKVGAIHRTLSTYVEAGLTAGLTLEGLREPRPNAGEPLDPGLELYQRVPWALVLCWRRVAGHQGGDAG